MGHLVDTQHRLRILQLAIFFQKIATASAYAAFVAIFFIDKLLEAGSQGKNAQGPIWVLFTAIVLFGIVVKLATVCIQISVERDWATSIGEGDTVRLMRVNTWLRRIDLVCKLISPLFVSMLTTAISYRFATAFLCGMAVVTASIEVLVFLSLVQLTTATFTICRSYYLKSCITYSLLWSPNTSSAW